MLCHLALQIGRGGGDGRQVGGLRGLSGGVRQNEALLLFLWVGSGALRRVRGRSSQVIKGACGVAARVRFAPP
jgi:hypothetical protein